MGNSGPNNPSDGMRAPNAAGDSPNRDPGRAVYPRLKVLYLLVVTVGVFVLPPAAGSIRPEAAWLPLAGVAALALVQAALLLANRIGPIEIARACSRVKWLMVFLVACSAFLRDAEGDAFTSFAIPAAGWTVAVNVTGVEVAVLMCLQIATVILVSALVQATGSGTELVDGLRGLGLPRLFVYSIDNTLALLGGVRRPGRRGGRRGAEARGRPREESDRADDGETPAGQRTPSFFATLGRLVRGDLGFFLDAIRSGQARARSRIEQTLGDRADARLLHDAAVISGIGLLMMSMKMLKFLPGIAFASGHKTLLLIPLYVLASRLTYSRWGGTVAGSIMGVIGLLMGDGRYGVFEVLKHVVPGAAIDLLAPVVIRMPHWVVVYCALGFVAAVARTTTEFGVVVITALSAGNLWQTPELQLFPAVKLVPNLFFGTLSGIVTYYVLGALDPARGGGVESIDMPAPGHEPRVTTSAAVAPGGDPAGDRTGGVSRPADL